MPPGNGIIGYLFAGIAAKLGEKGESTPETGGDPTAWVEEGIVDPCKCTSC